METEAGEAKRRFVSQYFAIVVALGVVLLMLLAASCLSGLAFDVQEVVILTLVAPALALGAFATFSHFHPRIAFIANTLGFIPLFGTLFAPISYMAIALGKSLPLCDPSLAALDAALGFDWPAMLRWLNGQPLISDAARIAYLSFGAQMTIAGIVCGITRQFDRGYGLVLASIISMIVAIGAVIFTPALGAYEHFGLTKADHPNIDLEFHARMTEPIMALREGRLAVFTFAKTTGLISMPSMHAAWAVTLIWCMWRTPYLRWGFLALNIGMLAATPIHGSHYLVDVIAGAAVGVVSIAAAVKALAYARGEVEGPRVRGSAIGGSLVSAPA